MAERRRENPLYSPVERALPTLWLTCRTPQLPCYTDPSSTPPQTGLSQSVPPSISLDARRTPPDPQAPTAPEPLWQVCLAPPPPPHRRPLSYPTSPHALTAAQVGCRR